MKFHNVDITGLIRQRFLLHFFEIRKEITMRCTFCLFLIVLSGTVGCQHEGSSQKIIDEWVVQPNLNPKLGERYTLGQKFVGFEVVSVIPNGQDITSQKFFGINNDTGDIKEDVPVVSTGPGIHKELVRGIGSAAVQAAGNVGAAPLYRPTVINQNERINSGNDIASTGGQGGLGGNGGSVAPITNNAIAASKSTAGAKSSAGASAAATAKPVLTQTQKQGQGQNQGASVSNTNNNTVRNVSSSSNENDNINQNSAGAEVKAPVQVKIVDIPN
jgi:hypothetical protein